MQLHPFSGGLEVKTEYIVFVDKRLNQNLLFSAENRVT